MTREQIDVCEDPVFVDLPKKWIDWSHAQTDRSRVSAGIEGEKHRGKRNNCKNCSLYIASVCYKGVKIERQRSQVPNIQQDRFLQLNLNKWHAAQDLPPFTLPSSVNSPTKTIIVWSALWVSTLACISLNSKWHSQILTAFIIFEVSLRIWLFQALRTDGHSEVAIWKWRTWRLWLRQMFDREFPRFIGNLAGSDPRDRWDVDM